MLTAFGAKRNYISKLMSNPNNTVLINNMPGATSQVNPQLNKLPGVINEAASGSIEASSPKSVDVAQTTPRATPEAKLETSESSDTSIPTPRQNVNREREFFPPRVMYRPLAPVAAPQGLPSCAAYLLLRFQGLRPVVLLAAYPA